jgi:hypothetical protein
VRALQLAEALRLVPARGADEVARLVAEPVRGDLAEHRDAIEPVLARLLGDHEAARHLEITALQHRERGALVAVGGVEDHVRDPVPGARVDVHRHDAHPSSGV